ncbi:MAG: hypothetical protein ACR2JA_09050 [Hydrogenophaga sp.]|uniref:hypothetical protein n=1 Tax=Hydrogenophaga sp. TaxID=1904254 RepID=UPI003D9B944C
MLYTHYQAAPAPLPARVRLPDGSTRTALHQLPAAALAALGYLPAPAAPTPGPGDVVEWSAGAWQVRAMTAGERAEQQRQARAALEAAVQQHLDATAQARGYDSILSACTYAASTSARFRPEGAACIAWRDAVWLHCHAVLAAVMAGARPTPTAAELLAELPAAIQWPGQGA